MARERLLSGVRADMSLQQPRSRERFTAKVALARQRVRTDVHLERAQRRVHLRAVFAAEGLAREATLCCSAMVLLVFRKSGVSGVGFCTVGALVAWTSWGRHRHS